jgi:hypothetical protein
MILKWPRRKCVRTSEIEFLVVAEDEECFNKAYVGIPVDVSALPLWVIQVKEAETRGAGLHNGQWRGSPCSAVMRNICQAAELLLGDLCMTTDGLCTILSVDKANVISITEVLGYFKALTLWVLQMVIDAHTKARASSPNDISL